MGIAFDPHDTTETGGQLLPAVVDSAAVAAIQRWKTENSLSTLIEGCGMNEQRGRKK